MKKILFSIIFIFCALFSCTVNSPSEEKTAAQIVEAMGAGWNLGNTLDACDESGENKGLETETSWGMPKTTAKTIKTIADAGFKSIRIPVSWHNHLTNGTIDAAWIARVKEIVDWALENDLYAVINIHHDTWNGSDNFWGYYPDSAHKEKSVEYVKNIWRQVAREFASYDQRLIFETLNEPRLRGTNHEWWCNDYMQNGNCSSCSEAVQIINELNKTALETIRAVGENNSTRLVIVPSYAASPNYAFKDSFKVPNDSAKMVALSTHMYTPYDFAMASPGETIFSKTHENDLKYHFRELNSKFVKNGMPVFIGEYGATNKNNKDERIKWVKFFVTNASENKMSPCLWDNNDYVVSETGDKRFEEKFGYLNRNTLVWYDKDFIDAIMASFGK